jgi:hypothetical protein
MPQARESLTQRRKLLNEIQHLAEVAVLERCRKPTAPVDGRVATASAADSSMVQT